MVAWRSVIIVRSPSTSPSNVTKDSKPSLDWMTIILAALAVGCAVGLYLRSGLAAVYASLGENLLLLLEILPIVALAVTVAGYAQILVPQQTMERWLGGQSGLRGLVVAEVAGALTPGGPFAAFPLVLALYRAGASLATCVTFLTAWSLIGLNRALVWEIPFLGWEFVAVRLAVSLPLPILSGMLVQLLAMPTRAPEGR